MIIGLICFIIVVILTTISISLRLIASGISISKKVVQAGSKKQPGKIDSLVNGSVATLRFAARVVARVRNFFLATGSVGAVVVGMIALLLIGSMGVYSVIINRNLNNSISNQIDKDKKKNSSCSENWTEVEVCETQSSNKTYMGYDKVTAQDTDQWKMFHKDAYGKFEIDDLGFGFIDDEDPDTGEKVKYYTVALGSYYTGGTVGVKFRMTTTKGKTFYVISSDQKADGDTHAGNKSEEIKKGMSASEIATNNPERCIAGADDMIEFVIDEKKGAEAIGVQGGYISGGSMDKHFDDDHPFEGAITKVERLDPNANPAGCEEDGESTDSLKITGPVIWVGDSRFVQLGAGVMGMSTQSNPDLGGAAMIVGEETEYNGNKEIVFAKGSGNLTTGFKRDEAAITAKITSDTTIVINYGVNNGPTAGTAEALATEYADYVNSLAKGKWSKARKIVYMSVNPGDSAKAQQSGMHIDNDGVKAFNKALQSKLDSSITWLNTYDTFINHPQWSDMAEKCDGIHYAASPALNKIAYSAVRGGGANGSFVATASGYEADLTERYYAYDATGVQGNPHGLKKYTTEEAEYSQSGYAAARSWDVNNHLGAYPMPENWTAYAEKGQPVLWDKDTKEELQAHYGYNEKDPLDKSILVYRNRDNTTGYAFIEMTDTQQNRISISETSGKKGINYGYTIKMYKNLSEYLKEKDAELIYMVKPIKSGH